MIKGKHLRYTDFFILCKTPKGVQLDFVRGYTDGMFNYYKRKVKGRNKEFTKWYAVHPSTGMLVEYDELGTGLKFLIDYVHTSDVLEKVQKVEQSTDEDIIQLMQFIQTLNKNKEL